MRRSRKDHAGPMSQSFEGVKEGNGAKRCRIPRMMSPVYDPISKKTAHGNSFETTRPKSAGKRQKEQNERSNAQPPHHLLISRQAGPDKERLGPKRPSTLPKVTLPPRPLRTVINIPISREPETILNSQEHEGSQVGIDLNTDESFCEMKREELKNTTPQIDMSLLSEVTNKILAMCEQTLNSRKDIIYWFEDVVTKKVITKNILVSKINQIRIENDQFKSSLDSNTQAYLRIFNETSEILKKSANISIVNQLRLENFTSKLSEMDALNQELQKKLQAMEQIKSTTLKRSRIEELENELKDEKSKKLAMRDRLSKAEIQVKIKQEKIAQLKTASDQANSTVQTLEMTVSQLREENQKLQTGYDKKTQILNESIDKNTRHLEEIMADRSKLLTEKEDLERRLTELSKHYEEALRVTKREISSNVAKLIETEKKYNVMAEEKIKLEDRIESLCAQLLESELRFKDASNKLSELEFTLRGLSECHNEIKTVRRQLTDANKELLEYKELTIKQAEAIKELERNRKNVVESEQLLKIAMMDKEEYISDLEKQRTLLEQLLQESESKTEAYENQLSKHKNNINQLQKYFGEFEDWEELQEMVKQKTMQLNETTQQNCVLTETLKKKELELQQQVETVTETRHLLEERDAAVKILTDKDEEQTNLIQLLRNNLEMRTQADVEINQQLVEKTMEIESLIGNIETRKQQISQLEKIILTLENQTLKLSNQKRKTRQTISSLENKLMEYESYYKMHSKYMECPTEHFDDLINILERELSYPTECQFNSKSQEDIVDSLTLIERENKQGDHKKLIINHPENNSGMSEQRVPTKVVMGNYVKKTYIPMEDTGDNLGRKKAIMTIESSEWDASLKMKPRDIISSKDNKNTVIPLPVKHQTRNIPYCLIPNYISDEKKRKMFKFAGHKLQ